MSSALDLLNRLARQELDRQRQRLAADEARLAVLENVRHAAQSTARDAIEIAAKSGEQLPFWAGIIEGGRRQSIAVADRIDQQQLRVGAARDVLTDGYLELKRLELLSERRKRAILEKEQAEERAEQAQRIARLRSGAASQKRGYKKGR